MATRTEPHKVEQNAKNGLWMELGHHGQMETRDVTGRDWGFDFLIEIFADGEITGKLAYVQLKGVECWANMKIIKKRTQISIGITPSSAKYASQQKIPFFVIVASAAKDENGFYFMLLQSVANEAKFQKRVRENKKSIQVHLPYLEPILENSCKLYQAIVDYYG